MALKEITPLHLRCGIGQCPAVYEYDAGDLIIVGKIVGDDILAELAGKVGSDEYAVLVQCLQTLMTSGRPNFKQSDVRSSSSQIAAIYC